MKYSLSPLKLLFLAVFSIVLLGVNNAEAKVKSPKKAFESSIVVLAPTSLTNALVELSRIYSGKNNISLSLTYDASSELVRIVEDGEPANIFITEDDYKIKYLQRRGTLDVFSLSNIISDSIVFAVSKGNFLKKKLEKIDDVNDKIKYVAKTISLVITDSKVDSSGKFIKQMLNKAGAWDDVEKRMLKASSNRNALYLISEGYNAGFVYKSDIYGMDNIEVLFEVPQDYYDKITYKALIVGGISSDGNKEKTEDFIKFLQTIEARDVFLKYGFSE
jgi:molybdate transport system substrate-binding protein